MGKIKSEDMLKIALDLNYIAMVLDEQNFKKVENKLKEIEEVLLKYVEDEKDKP